MSSTSAFLALTQPASYLTSVLEYQMMIRNYRFFLDLSEGTNSLDLQSKKITVSDQDIIKQITQVLRLREDSAETISFFDNSSKVYESKIQKIDPKSISLEILNILDSERELSREIKFFIPVIKMDKFEMMVQKLTELGVQTMIPILFKRSQGFNLEKLNNKNQKARLRKIIIEATEQCEGAKLAELKEPIKFSEISNYLDNEEARIYASESICRSLKDYKLSAEKQNQTAKAVLNTSRLVLLVGPEGGITDEENQSLSDLLFSPFSLGKRVLKAETAAIALFSALEAF